WENIIYQFGEAESLITHVIKKGKLIFSQETGFVGFENQTKTWNAHLQTVQCKPDVLCTITWNIIWTLSVNHCFSAEL
ncbi:hypothetical protein CSKR_203150, partial [Clonorchis sinensis]